VGRKHLWRRVGFVPAVSYIKPAGTPPELLEEVSLLVEEAEALRLKDLEGLEQEDCAGRMNVSRRTFARLLDSARHKVAGALIYGKAIRIAGGRYEMANRRFRCLEGHEWEVPFEVMIKTPPENCPRCDTPSIMPLFMPVMHGHRHGRK